MSCIFSSSTYLDIYIYLPITGFIQISLFVNREKEEKRKNNQQKWRPNQKSVIIKTLTLFLIIVIVENLKTKHTKYTMWLKFSFEILKTKKNRPNETKRYKKDKFVFLKQLIPEIHTFFIYWGLFSPHILYYYSRDFISIVGEWILFLLCC